MVARLTPLEALFYAGAHGEVLKATVDSASGDYADDATPLVVGALVFTGRSDEAATVFRSWERARGEVTEARVEEAAASRFFLCIAECRAGRYAAGERLCRATLAELRGPSSPRARYYFHQGTGLVRHFTGRIGSAARHAARARRYALEARFTYGRMLALDLLGHTLVHRGRVLAGLTVLEQAAELAEGIDLRSFALTTRSAIVAYRAHFGAGEPNPVARLEAHLARVGDADRYSKRLILTELAKAHAFRGEAALAAREVRRAEDVALPDGDRRATVKLHLVRALVAGLSLGEEAAAGWLAQAQRLLDPAWDAALDAEVAWYEYLVCPSAFSARSAEALVACARRTGIARAEHLAAASGAAGMTLAAEDRFAATVRAIREPGRGLDEVMAAELLGLLPMCFERSPGQRVYVDASRAVFALEDHGNVTCRELPSAALLTLLRALARGTRSKEDLIREVWNLKVYRPETHDAVVHTAVSRLRTTLEPHAAWIQVSSAGYALASHVELVDLLDTTDAPRSIAASASEASSAPAAVVPDRASRRRLLALEIVQRSGGAATRDVAEALKISDMTAFRVLSALVAEGLIEKVGQGRNTRYVRPPR